MASGGSFAKAQGLSEFQEAEEAYEAQDWERAVQLLEALVGTEPPALQNPLLVLESRKYLAIAYLFLSRQEDAERQFRLLLEQDPTYRIDPLLPLAVRQTFAAVRDRLEEERRAEQERLRQEEEARRQREIERLRRVQEREMRLRDLASTETVEVENSRWTAAIPFGVGQFQNGDDDLGLILLLTEGALAAGSLGTFIAHEVVRSEVEATDTRDPDAPLVGRALRIANWISTGLFAATAVIGVLDAQLRFVPFRREIRERELPPDLLEPGDLDVGIGPTGASLRVHF